jgi:hypothetical protein
MLVHIGYERYLYKIWKQQYPGYVMNIIRRWNDGMVSVRFERID